jgi:hypothetical protein
MATSLDHFGSGGAPDGAVIVGFPEGKTGFSELDPQEIGLQSQWSRWARQIISKNFKKKENFAGNLRPMRRY